MTDDEFSCSGYKQATRLWDSLGTKVVITVDCFELWRCEKPLEKICAEADNSQTEGKCAGVG